MGAMIFIFKYLRGCCMQTCFLQLQKAGPEAIDIRKKIFMTFLEQRLDNRSYSIME